MGLTLRECDAKSNKKHSGQSSGEKKHTNEAKFA